MYKIMYISDNGAVYSEYEEEGDEYKLECGVWTTPFLNEKGNSQAFGLVECILQSDNCPQKLHEGKIIKVEVVKV